MIHTTGVGLGIRFRCFESVSSDRGLCVWDSQISLDLKHLGDFTGKSRKLVYEDQIHEMFTHLPPGSATLLPSYCSHLFFYNFDVVLGL